MVTNCKKSTSVPQRKRAASLVRNCLGFAQWLNILIIYGIIAKPHSINTLQYPCPPGILPAGSVQVNLEMTELKNQPSVSQKDNNCKQNCKLNRNTSQQQSLLISASLSPTNFLHFMFAGASSS